MLLTPSYLWQAYMSSVLDLADAGIKDVDNILVDLQRMDTILNTDVNATYISANIAVRLILLFLQNVIRINIRIGCIILLPAQSPCHRIPNVQVFKEPCTL